MRFSFFNDRFVATADNQLEEIGMKTQHGKIAKLSYRGRMRGRDGEGKAASLYFDFIDHIELANRIKALELLLNTNEYYNESGEKILVDEIKQILGSEE